MRAWIGLAGSTRTSAIANKWYRAERRAVAGFGFNCRRGLGKTRQSGAALKDQTRMDARPCDGRASALDGDGEGYVVLDMVGA